MNMFASAFSPNKAVSKPTIQIITSIWLVSLIIAWSLNPFPIVPKPWEVVYALGDVWAQGLAKELYVSFMTNLQAIILTTIISVGLSYLTVLPAVRPLVEIISKARFLGLVGITFLFTITIGSGHALKVALLTLGMTVFFLTSMAKEVASIPKDKLDHARTLRMSEWRVVWEVVVLGTADKAIEVMRQNAAMGWMMLTMVEGLVRSEGGIGTMLLNQNKHFALAAVFAIQILILVVGILQDYFIGVVRSIACPYADLKLERK